MRTVGALNVLRKRVFPSFPASAAGSRERILGKDKPDAHWHLHRPRSIAAFSPPLKLHTRIGRGSGVGIRYDTRILLSNFIPVGTIPRTGSARHFPIIHPIRNLSMCHVKSYPRESTFHMEGPKEIRRNVRNPAKATPCVRSPDSRT